jgi:hypothetical protein
VDAPIYVADEVMELAGMEPEPEMSLTGDEIGGQEMQEDEEVDKDLGAFNDFVEGLDLDNLLGA